MVILIIILIFVGPKKLPEMAHMLGKAMSEFRRASDEMTSEFNKTVREVSIKEAEKTENIKKDDELNNKQDTERSESS